MAGNRIRFDPVTLAGVVAGWCFISCVSFSLSENLIQHQLYQGLAQFGLRNTQYAWITGMDGLLLTYAMRMHSSMRARCLISLGSSFFWLIIGCQVVKSGLSSGVFDRSGFWDLVCGVCCGFATIEWPFHNRVKNHG
jgi:hypothetical protein